MGNKLALLLMAFRYLPIKPREKHCTECAKERGGYVCWVLQRPRVQKAEIAVYSMRGPLRLTSVWGHKHFLRTAMPRVEQNSIRAQQFSRRDIDEDEAFR
jgi:hypothetical protein